MMTSQILKSTGFTKTRKSRYLENETLYFLQIKKIHKLHIKRCCMTKNSFVAEVTFKNHVINTKAIYLVAIGLFD